MYQSGPNNREKNQKPFQVFEQKAFNRGNGHTKVIKEKPNERNLLPQRAMKSYGSLSPEAGVIPQELGPQREVPGKS